MPTASTASPPRRGRPRSSEADRAILDATMRLLSTVGFAGAGMTAIAHEAGVSTATLYRRYPDREAVVVDALSARTKRYRMPDTGTLAGDLRTWLGVLIEQLAHPSGGRLIAALLDEASRNPRVATALYDNVSAPLRADITDMFTRAIARGEMHDDIDLELAIDLAVGPIYLRRLEAIRPTGPDDADRLTQMVLAAVCAPPLPHNTENET